MKELKLTKYMISIPHNEYMVLFHTIYGYLDIIPNSVFSMIKNGEFSEIRNQDYELLLSRKYLTDTKQNEEKILLSQLCEYKKIRKRIKNVYLVFSYNCNFDCIYCFEQDKSGNQIEAKVLDKILERLTLIHNEFDFVLTLYGGEPLLIENYANLKRIFSFALKLDIRVRIITNGFTIKPFLNLFLKFKSVLEEFINTIDGNESVHDSTRITKNHKGTFKRIRENIELLDNESFPVIIRSNIGIENEYKIVEFIENNALCKDHNVKLYFVENNRGLLSNRSTISDKTELIKRINRVCNKHENIELVYPPLNQMLAMIYDDNFVLPLFDYCNSNSIILYDYEGVPYSCTESCGNKDYIISDIQDEHYFTDIPKCLKCHLGPICGGGCKLKNNKQCKIEMENFIIQILQDVIEENFYEI